jgi:hypothetical protein
MTDDSQASGQSVDEKVQIGLGDAAHGHLKRLKEDGHFGEMKDAYTFAVALALAHGMIADQIAGKKTTIFGVATIDPDGALRDAIRILRPDTRESITSTMERLAEWGVEELHRRVSQGTLSFRDLLAEVNARLEKAR